MAMGALGWRADGSRVLAALLALSFSLLNYSPALAQGLFNPFGLFEPPALSAFLAHPEITLQRPEWVAEDAVLIGLVSNPTFPAIPRLIEDSGEVPCISWFGGFR
jgi:hypothetical protein